METRPVSPESVIPVSGGPAPVGPVSDSSLSVGSVSVSPVFVGRAAEFAALVDALTRAAAPDDGRTGGAGDGPRALLIGGEAGVGKTKLAEEFLGEAVRRGAVAAVGGCVGTGADGLPYAPFSTTCLRATRRRPRPGGSGAPGSHRTSDTATADGNWPAPRTSCADCPRHPCTPTS
ncbi:ATP-binding protein [Streptomyces sp. NPDC058770]|uniref:ATP-binding protein n=2 Tax=Streptomyces TaxID=1883 RepID=UPI003699BF64